MNPETWLLIDGKVHKLVDIFDNEQEANNFALALQDNCYTTIYQMKNILVNCLGLAKTR